MHLVRVWEGDRNFERRLKNRHNGPHLCPLCNETAHNRAPEAGVPLEEALACHCEARAPAPPAPAGAIPNAVKRTEALQ